MNTVDFSNLYRSTIGFDRLASLLEGARRYSEADSSYPPYNIEAVGEDRYAISIAVAGFERAEIDINVEQGVLTVRGRKAAGQSERKYLYQGIATRAFVDNAETIRVKFPDGREFVAKITGADPQSDVAVIEIETGGLEPLPLADSAKLDVGEWVVAIGNPFGLSHTLTVGVVSAKGRTGIGIGINDYEDFIQTDAAINPGNSGGPLLNLEGEVVGINTAIFSRSGGYMGVGFAIPINLANAIANQLIEDGEVTRGYLGVIIQPMNSV